MSFAFTEQERLRVFLAQFMGITLDPISNKDLAAIITWSSIYFIQLFPILYTLWHRRNPDIQQRNAPLMFLIYLCSIIYFFSDFVTQEMLHPTTPILRNCIFIIVWLRSICGHNMIVNILTIHACRVYCKYRLRKKLRGGKLWLVVGKIVVVGLVTGITISLLPTHRTIIFVDTVDICQFNETFKTFVSAMNLMILGVLLAVCLVLHLFVAKECKDKEHVEVTWAALGLLVALLFQTILFIRKPMYPAGFHWRVAVLSLDQAAALGAWWVVMGRVTWRCLLNKHKY